MSHAISRPHLVVATPCYAGHVTSLYATSLLGLQAACGRAGIDVSFRLVGGDALITRARNMAVQQFLTIPSASHLIFIDADIGFAPQQVFALLAAGKDVAGAIYPLKRLDWERIRRQAAVADGKCPAAALNYVVDLLDAGDMPPGDEFFRVRSIGTGFMMIARDVFTRMASHYPALRYRNLHVGGDNGVGQGEAHAFFDCMIDRETGTYLSEDYAFCKRWRDMGGDIWAYAASRLTHFGAYAFEGDLAAFCGKDGLSVP